jgi:L-alanine-DL-glutamate epimerase-like enolase superfamily enzyme
METGDMHITAVQSDPASGLLRLCTDGPHEGWAIGVTALTAAAIDEIYRPLLLGTSPWERERLWQTLKREGRRAGLPPATWGVVDIALWDLLGKMQDLPVFRVIGGFRDRVPAYLCGSPDAASDEILDRARTARDEGFWGYETTIGSEEDSTALMRELRQAVGGKFRLLGNGDQNLDLETALSLGRVLDEIGAHWFKDPLRDHDLTGLQKLSDALDTPVVAGAFLDGSILTGTRALTTRAVDRLRATIPTTGGITDVLKLARGAEALGMNCEIDWDRHCAPHAAAHLLGAVRNAEFFACDASADETAIIEPLPIVDGELLLPQEPGLGLRFTNPSLVS